MTMPSWSVVPSPADPVELNLPIPYQARLVPPLGLGTWQSLAWLSRRVGGTSVTFFDQAFVLEQPQVFGVILLDAFDLGFIPVELPNLEFEWCKQNPLPMFGDCTETPETVYVERVALAEEFTEVEQPVTPFEENVEPTQEWVFPVPPSSPWED